MKKKTKTLIIIAAAAVIIVAGIIVVLTLRKSSQTSTSTSYPSGVKTVTATYPQTMNAQEFLEGTSSMEWMESYREQLSKSISIQKDLNHYYTAIIPRLLIAEDENTVCSPLNTDIAFSMLAEVSGGNTRKQILEMLGASDIETVRENVSALWESNYVDTPVLKSVLANCLARC